MKILENYWICRGVIEGGESYKAKSQFKGGWEKWRKTNNFI